MKLDLPKILMSIILAITLQSGYCELKNPIDILQVDSVEVLAVNPFTLSEFRVDRLHFDDVFRIYNKSSKRIVLKHPKDYTIYLKILNSLPALTPEEVKVKPSEVKLLTARVDDLGYMADGETNDPILVSEKINIYMHDGNIRTAFKSWFYIDIDDWRYFDRFSDLHLIILWFISYEM